MKVGWVLLAASCAMVGCSKQEAPGANLAADTAPAAAAGAPAPQKGGGGQSLNHTPRPTSLAYSRTLHAEIKADGLKPLYEQILEACTKDVVDECEQMNSQMLAGDSPSADIKLRLKAAGVPQIRAVVDKGAKITEETVAVEDLGGSIIDNSRRISLLKNYEGAMTALQARSSSDLDTLMRIARETADTQAEIEQLSGTNGDLQDRVALQTLEINLGSTMVPPAEDSPWRHIGEALVHSVHILSDSLAMVIQLLAFLLPWVAVGVPGAFVGRAVVRRWR